MEQTIRAATDGVVESIKVKTGQIVSPGDVLVQIGADEHGDDKQLAHP
jgi:biotin carboxyl carrier protein